jgi:hypothetical protein
MPILAATIRNLGQTNVSAFSSAQQKIPAPTMHGYRDLGHDTFAAIADEN